MDVNVYTLQWMADEHDILFYKTIIDLFLDKTCCRKSYISDVSVVPLSNVISFSWRKDNAISITFGTYY